MSEATVTRRSPVVHRPRTAHARSSLLGSYTHLKRNEAIFVTGWERTEEHGFSLDIKWPVAEGPIPYDPRVINQTIRQCGLVIAHAEYGVPLSHQTVLSTFDVEFAPDFVAPRRPAELTVEVRVAAPSGDRRPPTTLRMSIHVMYGGVTVARTETKFGWISPPVYRRLRGDHLTVDWGSWPLTAPVPPASIGRGTTDDVLLSPGDRPHRWLLRHPVDNTLLFDHPVDHVPGLVLIEAAEQAARAHMDPAPFHPTRVTTSFARYVEFDRPCTIEVEPLDSPGRGESAVKVLGVQDGQPAFASELIGRQR